MRCHTEAIPPFLKHFILFKHQFCPSYKLENEVHGMRRPIFFGVPQKDHLKMPERSLPEIKPWVEGWEKDTWTKIQNSSGAEFIGKQVHRLHGSIDTLECTIFIGQRAPPPVLPHVIHSSSTKNHIYLNIENIWTLCSFEVVLGLGRRHLFLL